MSKWKWINHEGQTLRDVGILEDGSLHNPHGYPEDLVRIAITAAHERLKARRSQRAKKAGVTRRRRQERLVYEIARKIQEEGAPIGPRKACAICGRGLDDQQSIERGIGPECWQGVMRLIERKVA